MYQAYWGLARSPFRGHLDPESFYQSTTHEEALARLQFLVEERRGLGLLVGEAGSGKSLVLEVFAKALRSNRQQPALLSLVGIGRREFLWRLAAELGVDVPTSAGQLRLCRALEDHLLANRYQQIATILLFDDAGDAQPDVLDEIVRLVQFNQARGAGLTVVLAARWLCLELISERLLELAELRIELENWDLEDTAAFVKKSLAGAGRSTPIFTEPAVRRLHELTGGVPRRLAQLADLALLGGAGANLAQIESETVESVYMELATVTAGPGATARATS